MTWETLAMRLAVGAAALAVAGATLYFIETQPRGDEDALPESWVLAGWPAMVRAGAVPPPRAAESAEGSQGEEEGEDPPEEPSETTIEQGSSGVDALDLVRGRGRLDARVDVGCLPSQPACVRAAPTHQ